jgi:hypothetical protein
MVTIMLHGGALIPIASGAAHAKTGAKPTLSCGKCIGCASDGPGCDLKRSAYARLLPDTGLFTKPCYSKCTLHTREVPVAITAANGRSKYVWRGYEALAAIYGLRSCITPIARFDFGKLSRQARTGSPRDRSSILRRIGSHRWPMETERASASISNAASTFSSWG